jgi:hypothetical protein
MKTQTRLAAGMCLSLLASVGAIAADRDPPSPSAPELTVATVPAVAAAPNCLLPGQIRSFGGQALLTPKRAVTLDRSDCVARGGEPMTPALASN